MRTKQQPDRRRSRRLKIGQPLKVRPSDPKDEHFEELAKTKNASREGIYFITQRQSYYPGMRLFVTVPFYSPTDPMNCEFIGQVTRVEELANGEHGIAVLLLSSIGMKPAATFSGAHRE